MTIRSSGCYDNYHDNYGSDHDVRMHKIANTFILMTLLLKIYYYHDNKICNSC